jgi:hypothetical protein
MQAKSLASNCIKPGLVIPYSKASDYSSSSKEMDKFRVASLRIRGVPLNSNRLSYDVKIKSLNLTEVKEEFLFSSKKIPKSCV